MRDEAVNFGSGRFSESTMVDKYVMWKTDIEILNKRQIFIGDEISKNKTKEQSTARKVSVSGILQKARLTHRKEMVTRINTWKRGMILFPYKVE